MQADHEIRTYDDPSFPFSVFEFHNLGFMAHWHDEVELCLVTEGALLMGVNGREVALRPGLVGVAESQAIHYYTASGANRGLLLLVNPSLLPACPSWLEPPGDSPAGAVHDPEAVRVLTALWHERQAEASDWRSAVLGYASVLFAMLGRHAIPAPAGAPRAPLRMRRALTYLAQHFREDLTLASVADHVALSPWAFSHQFAAATGRHFRAYLNGLRVRAARPLLAAGERTVVDIALDCGFASLRTFNRAYRSETGQPPRQSRRGRPDHP